MTIKSTFNSVRLSGEDAKAFARQIAEGTAMTGKYYKVVFEVYAFDTEEKAADYLDDLVNAFCAMDESSELGSSSHIVECLDGLEPYPSMEQPQ